MLKSRMFLTGVLALAASPAFAQSSGQSGMSGMNHDMMMKNTAANPYAEAEMQMSHRMMSAVGTDASETWTRKMIEHHRGAIAMSDILMAKGADKELKAMAQKTKAEQQRGIAELQAWLKRHGKRAQ